MVGSCVTSKTTVTDPDNLPPLVEAALTEYKLEKVREVRRLAWADEDASAVSAAIQASLADELKSLEDAMDTEKVNPRFKRALVRGFQGEDERNRITLLVLNERMDPTSDEDAKIEEIAAIPEVRVIFQSMLATVSMQVQMAAVQTDESSVGAKIVIESFADQFAQIRSALIKDGSYTEAEVSLYTSFLTDSISGAASEAIPGLSQSYREYKEDILNDLEDHSDLAAQTCDLVRVWNLRQGFNVEPHTQSERAYESWSDAFGESVGDLIAAGMDLSTAIDEGAKQCEETMDLLRSSLTDEGLDPRMANSIASIAKRNIEVMMAE